MFRRRDVPPLLLLVFLILLVMLTLSQILVVHSGRYTKSGAGVRRLQLELRQMDLNLHSLMMHNVPSIDLHQRQLQNQINAHRVQAIMAEAARTEEARGQAAQPMEARGQAALPEEARGQAARLDEARGQAARTKEARGQAARLDEARGHAVLPEEARGQAALPEEARGQAALPDEARGQVVRTVEVRGQAARPEEARGQATRPYELRSQDARRNDFGDQVTVSEAVANQFERGLATPDQGDQDEVSHHHSPSVNRTTDYRRSNVSDTALLSSRGPDQNTSPCTVVSSCTSSSTPSTDYCPPVPQHLRGRHYVDVNSPANSTMEAIIADNPDVMVGGSWRPVECVARHKVAIVIPYRDRAAHLRILLSHLHPILQRQQLDYHVLVVEQAGEMTFNKATIMNAAFVEGMKLYPFECFIFHDVDLVPEDDRNMYSCPAQPRHMSVAIDVMNYKLAYQELVGGVLAVRSEHFQRLNGYSNLYWGWGAEDDDMAYRIIHVGLKITRPTADVARYKMIKHAKRKPADWRKRLKLLYTGTRRFQVDGLNSLQYKLLHVDKQPLFTHILVDIGVPPHGFR